MGADGAATLADPQHRVTVRQPVKKLKRVRSKMIVGVSGHVGMGQLLYDALENSKKSNPTSHQEANRAIGKAFHAEVRGPSTTNASQTLPTSMLVALCTGASKSRVGTPQLLQFISSESAGEAATRDLPFVAIGSGQPIADTFLAFIRHVFWNPDELPSLDQGLLAATWTLQHAIRSSPAYVGGPMQLMVLSGDTGKVHDIGPQACEVHESAVDEIEQYLRDFRASEPSALPPSPASS